ncbi:MAG: serine/threonine-protein kinase [Deltaproteobacteria bacterium]|nr:serine/threonine-protein kinase [Deltaproteobacteria bacterium]
MLAGAQIGKYQLERRVARGGMAEVWAASVRGPGDFQKGVALKFILAHFDEAPEAERLFLQEARLAASFSHANLLAVFDFDQIPQDAHPALAGRYFIAMELVDGGNLWQLLDARRSNGLALPEAQTAHVAVEALKGLAYLHEHKGLGLVHRDLSPQNILLTQAGQVKVSDFGVAKATAKLSAIRSNMIYGKLPYFAPELLAGHDASCATDLFALGVVLWEAFSGRSLFAARNEAETMENVRACKVPPPKDPQGGGPSPAFAEILNRLLCPSPQDRFPSANDALLAFLSLPSYDPSPMPLARFVRDAAVAREGKADPPPPVNETERQLPPTRVLIQPTRVLEPQAQPENTRVLPQNAVSGPPHLIAVAPVPNAPLNEASTSKEHPQGIRSGAADFVPGFDPQKLGEAMARALERFEVAKKAGIAGTFEEWVMLNADNGRDPITGVVLPVDFHAVLTWPRFCEVGWRVRLSPEWKGPRPWGREGFWVAEDRLSNESMVLHPEALGLGEYRSLSREQWVRWWQDREVNILAEGPRAKTLPVSERVRALLLPNEVGPRTPREYFMLLSLRDPESVNTDLRRRIDAPSAATAAKLTFWQRLLQGQKK